MIFFVVREYFDYLRLATALTNVLKLLFFWKLVIKCLVGVSYHIGISMALGMPKLSDPVRVIF